MTAYDPYEGSLRAGSDVSDMEDAPDIAAIFEDDFRRGRITA
jgi:hypothetical protein